MRSTPTASAICCWVWQRRCMDRMRQRAAGKVTGLANAKKPQDGMLVAGLPQAGTDQTPKIKPEPKSRDRAAAMTGASGLLCKFAGFPMSANARGVNRQLCGRCVRPHKSRPRSRRVENGRALPFCIGAAALPGGTARRVSAVSVYASQRHAHLQEARPANSIGASRHA